MGRVAVFVRFAGCNLWSGREADRASAVCRFCDTEFVGGEKYSATELTDVIDAAWAHPFLSEERRLVVFTGGEPALQLDMALGWQVSNRRFRIAVETNGTLPLNVIADWVCVSPKAGTKLALQDADELKLVYPQEGAEPERFRNFGARHRWLSPMDGPDLAANTAAAIAHCHAHPEWRLNIQAHKHWSIP